MSNNYYLSLKTINMAASPQNPTQRYDVAWQLLLRMDPATLAKSCQLNRMYREICNENAFWKQKIEQDFPDQIVERLGELTWKETWIAYHGEMVFRYYITTYEIGDVAEPGDVTDFSDEEFKRIREILEDEIKEFIREYHDLFKYFEYVLDRGDEGDNTLELTLFSRVIDTRENYEIYADDFAGITNHKHLIIGERNIGDDVIGLVLELTLQE